MIAMVMAMIAVSVPAGTRMTNCDYETVDWNGFVRVRAEYCMVVKQDTVTEIYVGQRWERWVIDGPKAWLMSTVMRWSGNGWYHDRSSDEVLWSGSVKIDQLACKTGGKTTIRYVFSDDSAICLP